MVTGSRLETTGGQIMLCEMHDSAQRNETVILDAHQADVHTLLFDNGCRRLISVGLDKRACVWNLNERPKLKPIVLDRTRGGRVGCKDVLLIVAGL